MSLESAGEVGCPERYSCQGALPIVQTTCIDEIIECFHVLSASPSPTATNFRLVKKEGRQGAGGLAVNRSIGLSDTGICDV